MSPRRQFACYQCFCWTAVAIRSSRSEEMPTDSGLAVGSSCASAAAATNSRYKIARVFALRLMAVGNTSRPRRVWRGPIVHPDRLRTFSHLESRKATDCYKDASLVGSPATRNQSQRLLSSCFPRPLRHARIETPLPNRHEPNRIRNARRQRTHHHSRNLARPRHHAGRISAHPEIAGPRRRRSPSWASSA